MGAERVGAKYLHFQKRRPQNCEIEDAEIASRFKALTHGQLRHLDSFASDAQSVSRPRSIALSGYQSLGKTQPPPHRASPVSTFVSEAGLRPDQYHVGFGARPGR